MISRIYLGVSVLFTYTSKIDFLSFIANIVGQINEQAFAGSCYPNIRQTP
ncbi:hypothetical protein SynWH8103_00516 [Synechococcus sp. WH 8103]|nr:hypothetical protein SynWH8103_00516 [Synechococcus sp. WH 8103]